MDICIYLSLFITIQRNMGIIYVRWNDENRVCLTFNISRRKKNAITCLNQVTKLSCLHSLLSTQQDVLIALGAVCHRGMLTLPGRQLTLINSYYKLEIIVISIPTLVLRSNSCIVKWNDFYFFFNELIYIEMFTIYLKEFFSLSRSLVDDINNEFL